ncbi:MAG: response regulator transcription factor [Desulfamplus sp.]|nr:response regulator transcription factor [Desulfamplus sp.]MBF0209598.1 response regulator transcription factor [Desulfamplus sp.]MBF0241791.1 response regulator transcription factor [Desulfamplus sp.]
MAKETILIVDDEEDIIELVRYNLEKEGYSTLSSFTGEDALQLAINLQPTLIVLDLMLPGIDGLEVTKILKANGSTSHIPIVMLTAKGEESDIVTGLELGANDYMSKPFSPRELVARVKANLRRVVSSQSESGVVKEFEHGGYTILGDMVIDHGRHIVKIANNPVDLTYSEFELLVFLSAKKGWVFTRGQIMDAIHGDNYAVTERSVDVIVAGLRKKLGEFAHSIETVRGVGYRFKDDSRN